MAKHKFYLAFENSNTKDYVTEKVFHAWRAGTVPIYMGAENIADFAPHPHSYIATSDFKYDTSSNNQKKNFQTDLLGNFFSGRNAKELADFIIHLDTHPGM